VTALAHFLQSRPRILPAAVTAQIVAGEQEVVRTASRLSIVAMVLWFACVPVVLAIGVREVFWMFAILVPALATLLLAVHAARRAYIPFWVQTGMVIGTLLGAAIAGCGRAARSDADAGGDVFDRACGARPLRGAASFVCPRGMAILPDDRARPATSVS
jgi:hypothetical protein